jgi:hypothetical protein
MTHRNAFGSITASDWRHKFACVALAGAAALTSCSGGGGGGSSSAQETDSPAMIEHWTEVSIDASGLDHTAVLPGENRVFGEQFGPARAARAIAIVHIAVFEAVNAIDGRFQSYLNLPPAVAGTSMRAAVGQAARDTLAAMFPSQTPTFDARLAAELQAVRDPDAKAKGIQLGHDAAAAILALRANDGSDHPEPHIGVDWTTSDQPGHWREDPVSQLTIALGARWNEVTPFAMTSADQFRVPPPPALDSPEYAAAYDEAKALGGDGVTTATVRDEDQTETGIFWAYDGRPSLCAPPRLYNQITIQLCDQMGLDTVDTARCLALANVAMADAGLAIWEAKYFYDFWRPVGGIRESDPGTGPSGLGDGNAQTVGDPNFLPLGAPASNGNGPNFTPPFPSYPSGHAGFGGALFQTLRNFFGTDDIAFTFTSDEFNGVTLDNQGVPRPVKPRSYSNLSEAEDENGQSRIYLGIHWRFDKEESILQGRAIADWVFTHLWQPAH